MEKFQEFVEKERARLNDAREELLGQRSEIDAKIAELDVEMNAVLAYERAKTGKPAPKRSGRRGIRNDVLLVVQKHPAGIKRAAILDEMSAKGDKAKETSVSNALAALKKQGHITSDASGYKAVA